MATVWDGYPVELLSANLRVMSNSEQDPAFLRAVAAEQAGFDAMIEILRSDWKSGRLTYQEWDRWRTQELGDHMSR